MPENVAAWEGLANGGKPVASIGEERDVLSKRGAGTTHSEMAPQTKKFTCAIWICDRCKI
jgi:hypothetical protein